MRPAWTGQVLVIALLCARSLAAEPGRLDYAGVISGRGQQYWLGGAHGVAVSPDGREVYVASFDDNALVVLARQRRTGLVTLTQALVDGVQGVEGLFRPVTVAVSPDGANVYVGAFFGDAVAVLARDAETNDLRFVDALYGGASGQRGLTQVHGLAMAPDGSQLFVASYGDNALAVLRRDPVSGRLAVEQVWSDASEGGTVAGMLRPTDVAVSADGANVFVVTMGSQSIVHFRRHLPRGELEAAAVVTSRERTIAGLAGAVAVAVSPDGRDVYTLGTDAVGHFRIDVAGSLSFVDAVSGSEVLGAGDAAGPTDLLVVPQGSAVVVTRGGDDTMVLLDRDRFTGTLQFGFALRDGEDGADGLAGVAGVACDPHGRWLYTAAQFDDAVGVFRRSSRCAGDCNEDGTVSVDELIAAVNELLADPDDLACWQVDGNADGQVTVDEVVTAVRRALAGCPFVRK